MRLGYFTVVATIAIALHAGVARADALVRLSGQTPDQIRIAITAAAEKVCTDAMIRHQLDDSSSEDECVADTVDAAMQKIKDGGVLEIAPSGAH